MNNNTPQYFEEQSPNESVRMLQVVRSGSSEFGIFAEEISTIVTWKEPTPLPQAPKSVLGVVSIEGRMLTVLDLAMLSVQEDTSSDKTRNCPGHIVALRGDEQLALAVDAVNETVDLGRDDSISTQETATRLVLGVLRREDTDINILDLRELFPTAIQGRERRRRRF